MVSGEEKAWETLQTLDPYDVCWRTGATFEESTGRYSLPSFGMDFVIAPREKTISSLSPGSEILIRRLAYFFNLSVLCYLNGAKDVPLSGRLAKPINLTGGQLFFRGTHVLPLDKVAEKYSSDKDAFLEKGKELGGEELNYGDASVKLLPLPKFPAVLILWTADDEFPARADLLLDSVCERQLPLDVIWSIAMMSVLIML